MACAAVARGSPGTRLPLINTTGTFLVSACARRAWQSWIPVMTGISMSLTTMCVESARTASNAVAPSAASVTVYPALRRIRAATIRMSGSSSAKTILAILLIPPNQGIKGDNGKRCSRGVWRSLLAIGKYPRVGF